MQNYYQKQQQQLKNYFRSGEKKEGDFKIGLESEFFILEQDSLLNAKYYGKDGIESILKDFRGNEIEEIYENDNLIALMGEEFSITLEPGGQLEISLDPFKEINKIESVFLDVIRKLNTIVRKHNKIIMAVGYLPVNGIDDILLLPKKRYHFMYNYFKDKGYYAHNMMKGTASIQINVDYADEKDYAKKMRVASFLSPLTYTVFDNAPFFEGRSCYYCTVRACIWSECDPDRCGLIADAFSSSFGYDDYAHFVLETPAIIKKEQDDYFYTEKKIKELFDPLKSSEQDLEHYLSMVFPDIRTKKFLEIRMGDSLPYPYILAYAAFWKGLLYNKNNLNLLYKRSLQYGYEKINSLKKDAYGGRYQDKKVMVFFAELLDLAGKGLVNEEKKYLDSLKEFSEKGISPAVKTLNRLRNSGMELRDNLKFEDFEISARENALKWCIVEEGMGFGE